MKSAQSTKARGVNPSDLRRINEGVVLAAMGPSHQYRVNELMRITNLTRVTVTDVLRQLQDKGWVAPHSTSRGRGRPAQIYGRVVPGGTVAGLEIGAYELAATIADMHGELLARDRRPVSPALPRRQRLDRAIDLLHSTLEEAGSSRAQLWTVMTATTGTVSPDGTVRQAVAIEDWAGINLSTEIGQRMGVPVEVRNDIQLFGRGEHHWGAASGFQHALLVWLGRRPTVSLIVRGEPYVGAHGTAGDLSRVGRTPGEGSGQRVQLPTLNLPAGGDASGGSTARSHRAEESDPLRTLLDEARDGSHEAGARIEQWFRELAPIISLSTAVVDPEVIVLGGPLVPLADDLVPILEGDLAVHLQHRPMVAVSAGGQDAIVDAAARYAVERVYTRLQDNGGHGVAPLSRDALRALP